jgi:allantoate deiminase
MGQLHDWMTAAGMSVRTDAAATLIGRLEGRTPGAPALVIGSHIDSVRDAGVYDGMLGVTLGLACIEAVVAGGWRPAFAIEVAGFGDEEGSRFQASMNGSRAFAGTLDAAAALGARDADGMTLMEALSDFRLDPGNLQDARRAPEDILAFIEPHIEQGPWLEAKGLALGVVSSIAGQWRLKVRMEGSAGHAGTTPMGMRRDALAAAAEAILAIESLATDDRSDLVATVGQIVAKPGAPNVVPGVAEFTVDVRAGTDAVRNAGLARIEARLAQVAEARSIALAIERIQNLPATAMDARLQGLLMRALRASGHDEVSLVSGAGHDAMMIAGMAPTGMLFIRCAGGVSHNPAESVTPEDCEAALAALLSFIELLDEDFS